jgi:phage terminase large subunit
MSLSTLQIPTARVFKPLLTPSRYKGVHGGRGSGKSQFFGGLAITKALSQPGLRMVCIREVQKSLEQSVKRLLDDKIAAFGVGRQFESQQFEIKTPGGGIIIFQGMQNHTADSIKSLEGYDIAWVEEAQSLSQRSLDLLRPTIRKPGSELWFSWNPSKEIDPVDTLLRGPTPIPGSVVVEANWQDNPWLPDVLRDEKDWDQRRDPDKYAHIWLGGYLRHSEARVFKNWKLGELEIPANARPYFGADWGFSVDPTVLVRCWVWDRTLYVDKEVFQVGCEIDHTPALFEKIQDDRTEKIRRWPITADNARPETISYMARQGFNIKPAIKGPGSVEDGIEFLKSYNIVVHPSCRHTSDELTLYSFKTDKQTNEILPVLEDKDNHCVDALRYSIEAIRRAPSRPVFGTYGM